MRANNADNEVVTTKGSVRRHDVVYHERRLMYFVKNGDPWMYYANDKHHFPCILFLKLCNLDGSLMQARGCKCNN